jgi:hypothetical protein
MQETNQNNPFSYRHNHDGINSEKLSKKAVASALSAPQSALTAKDSTSLTSGGVNNLKTSDSAVIDNMRTRINELETKLQALGLIS